MLHDDEISALRAENARLWRAILDHWVDLFGTAAQTGFCYWATDPADNPDYPRFIEDYHAATGNLPQTTTAAPLRDLLVSGPLGSASAFGHPHQLRETELTPTGALVKLPTQRGSRLFHPGARHEKSPSRLR